jgi:alkylglycerol monooxygenase
VQFSLYVAGGTLLLGMGGELSLAQTLLGVLWMALGLYIIGIWLENRANAKRLEILRLLLNLPLAWLALQLDLLPAQPMLWALLLGYSLLSLGALFWTPRGQDAIPA